MSERIPSVFYPRSAQQSDQESISSTALVSMHRLALLAAISSLGVTGCTNKIGDLSTSECVDQMEAPIDTEMDLSIKVLEPDTEESEDITLSLIAESKQAQDHYAELRCFAVYGEELFLEEAVEVSFQSGVYWTLPFDEGSITVFCGFNCEEAALIADCSAGEFSCDVPGSEGAGIFVKL